MSFVQLLIKQPQFTFSFRPHSNEPWRQQELIVLACLVFCLALIRNRWEITIINQQQICSSLILTGPHWSNESASGRGMSVRTSAVVFHAEFFQLSLDSSYLPSTNLIKHSSDWIIDLLSIIHRSSVSILPLSPEADSAHFNPDKEFDNELVFQLTGR